MTMQLLPDIQIWLADQNLSGWLLYDFRGSNSILYRLLQLPKSKAPTRRMALWIPQKGAPTLLLHAIETGSFPDLGIQKVAYISQNDWLSALRSLIKGKIAMEVVPNGEMPSLSLVDGGTLQAITSMGVEVVSSGELLSHASVLTPEEISSLREACTFLNQLLDRLWKEIPKQKWTELQAANWIEAEMNNHGFMTESSPHVAVNAHASDPHYHSGDTLIQKGDLILVDLWCKKGEQGIYADLTRMALYDRPPTTQEQTLFDTLLNAQKAGVELINTKKQVTGAEVDKAVRKVVNDAGFGPYFIHRTGHNIATSVHGPGTHLDSFETIDNRPLLPNTCCSLEPGIYIPNQIGLRLETDLLIHPDHVEVIGGWQERFIQIS